MNPRILGERTASKRFAALFRLLVRKYSNDVRIPDYKDIEPFIDRHVKWETAWTALGENMAIRTDLVEPSERERIRKRMDTLIDELRALELEMEAFPL